jgi:hypothetical protein
MKVSYMQTNSMSGGTLKPANGSTGWQNFLATVSDRRFLIIPFVTWAILQLAFIFGSKEIKSVIEFLANK